MEKRSVRKNHDEESNKRKHSGGIMEEESGKHLGGIWEASGKHLEASGRHLEGIWGH